MNHNDLYVQIVAAAEATIIDGLEARDIRILTKKDDEEIVEQITICLYTPNDSGYNPIKRIEALVEPRHQNSLLIEETAFAALLKSKIVTAPFHWEGMRPVCQLMHDLPSII